MKTQYGFTLVEIAIVLVVIGLLLGGVLKGQELLENGRIRKALNDFNTVAAATFTYQDRYRELPGDDDGATRFAGGVNSTSGDGVIDGNWNTTTVTEDAALFWQHLRLDGLVEGDGTAQPANAFNGITGVMFGNFAIGGNNEHVICMNNVTVKSAVIMDTRIDDGVTNPGTANQSGTFRINQPAGGGASEILATAPVEALTTNTPGRGTMCREL